MIKRGYPNGLVTVIRNLSGFAERDADGGSAEAHAVVESVVKGKDAAVDWIGVGWISRQIVTEAVYLVGGVKKAPYNNSSTWRIGRSDLLGGQAKAGALGGKNLCLHGNKTCQQKAGQYPWQRLLDSI